MPATSPIHARELPRAMLAAFAVVAVLYLGLAVTTIAVLGGATDSKVPLADLMQRGLGSPGRVATAAVAVLLTTGAMNAYVAGAGRLAGAIADDGAMPRRMARPGAPLAAVRRHRDAPPYAARHRPRRRRAVHPRPARACFVAVYVAATAAGARLLAGRVRVAAALSFVLVLVVFAFSGPYLAAPAAAALLGAWAGIRRKEAAADPGGTRDVGRVLRVEADPGPATRPPVRPDRPPLGKAAR